MKEMITNCYHMRDTNGIKLRGGMLHAKSHNEAAQRATIGLSIGFTCSRRAAFYDKNGKEVSLYLSIHPEHTIGYDKALTEYRAKKEAEAEQREIEEANEREDESELTSWHYPASSLILLSTMKSNLDQISEVLRSLNANYGRGSIVAVRLFLDGKGEFDRKPYGCRVETRKFRLNKETVFALEHQKAY